ncbi:septal ring lytic transglycosylase RlpA family protein [Roseofilum capinflatum]|uniref:Probable endolytic peptidoglycan transglycosylase RlpA n=1 Tax=Roseofilum capinflatum BLCC-M114 TaxID=3022440 RepID=A0ABT7BBT1_9CYAN|nr:septal ring lytic transglycosylase RlpA family protein [Roseofilum capinflatum]MDJ1176634.1 septal ring lytic transglycosylase RlpA family protein [Roseofilum capinflatum BLCC-M114]
MNQHLWKTLTVSALLLTLGSGSSGHAEPSANLVASESEAIAQREQDSTASMSAKLPEADPHSATKIYPHTLDGQEAATLYVQNIPVLTFLGEPITQETQETQEKAQEVSTVPMAQVSMVNLSNTQAVREAEAVAEKLSVWVRSVDDAEAIALKWDEDLETYLIQANDQTLVTMGQDVILPDTTQNSTQDAVQATNRLRRLLGNAPPIEEVYGKPVTAPGKALNNPSASQGEFVTVQAVSGWASWYGPGFHGNLTANGERYNQYGLTAAHRNLPFNTMVRVTNMDNGRSLVVRINDRGPYIRNRIIDLSKGAAQELGLMSTGVAPVRMEILERQ